MADTPISVASLKSLACRRASGSSAPMTWPMSTCHTAAASLRATATAALLRPRRAATASPHFCSGCPRPGAFWPMDEQRPDRSASVPLELAAAFPFAALAHARVESQVGHQFLAVGKAGHIADGRHQPEAGHRPDAAQPGEPQQGLLADDLLCHVRRSRVRRARAATSPACICSRSIAWAGLHALSASSRGGGGVRQPEARGQAHAVFVEHGADLLLGRVASLTTD